VGSSASQTFTFKNIGLGDIVLGAGAVQKAGTNADQFAITADNCSSQTLVPNGTCTVDVSFNPTSAGAKTAAIEITSSLPQITVALLSGTGLQYTVTGESGGNGTVSCVSPVNPDATTTCDLSPSANYHI
jgi:hypothetical protein